MAQVELIEAKVEGRRSITTTAKERRKRRTYCYIDSYLLTNAES
jgi:hypothetical protein